MSDSRITTLRSEPGTYALLLRVDADAVRTGAVPSRLTVGAAGTMDVRPGTYVYAGSAFGSGGVRARVRRHARTGDATTIHWHVDALRAIATLDAAWVTYDDDRRECDWADRLRSLPRAQTPLDGFGASDCSCVAHLVHVPTTPSLDAFRRRLRDAYPNHAPVHAWKPAPHSDGR